MGVYVPQSTAYIASSDFQCNLPAKEKDDHYQLLQLVLRALAPLRLFLALAATDARPSGPYKS